MNAFAYAGLADGARVAAALALNAEASVPGSGWRYAADAALFGNASIALRTALISQLWNDTLGAFVAGVLGDADMLGGSPAVPIPDGPSYYATMLAVAKGVLDNGARKTSFNRTVSQLLHT
jgi:hypothetical protein